MIEYAIHVAGRGKLGLNLRTDNLDLVAYIADELIKAKEKEDNPQTTKTDESKNPTKEQLCKAKKNDKKKNKKKNKKKCN